MSGGDALTKSLAAHNKRLARDRAWGKTTAARFAGLSVEAIVLAVRDSAFGVNWDRVANEALRRQLEFDEFRAKARHERARKTAARLLHPMTEEMTSEQYVASWEKYKRAAKRETRAREELDRIWRRWEALYEPQRADSNTLQDRPDDSVTRSDVPGSE